MSSTCPVIDEPRTEPSVAQDRAGVRTQKKTLLAEVNSAMADAPDEVEVFDSGRTLLEEIRDLGRSLPARSANKINAPDRARMEPCIQFGLDRFGLSEFDLLFLCQPSDRRSSFYAQPDEVNLLEALRRVVLSRESRHVTFQVIGGGSYRIPFCKAKIEAFAKVVAKGFPAYMSARPGRVGGEDLAEVHVGATAPKPTPIPALKKNVTADSVEEAAALLLNTEHSKKQLRDVMHDGQVTVATDGRAIAIFCGGKGMSPDAILKKHGEAFPNWRVVVPSTIKTDGGRFLPTGQGVLLEVDSGYFASVIIGMRGALSEYRDSVGLHSIGGSLGISYVGNGDPYQDVGFRTEGVEEGSTPLISLKYSHLANVSRQARLLGVKTIRILLQSDKDPATFYFEGRGIVVCMPMRAR